MAREAVQLYRNINKVDHWGGGGLSLSTIVKLAGWAGLIAILAVLVMKLREVEEQLDPVANIVTRLMKEVEASRVSIRQHTDDTRAELDKLSTEAEALRGAVFRAEEAQVATQHTLEEVDKRARVLADQLEQETTRAEALASQGDTATETLKAYARALTDLQKELKDTADQANGNVKALSDSLHKASDQTADLQKAIAGLQTSQAQSSLARVDAAAKDLALSLERAASRAKAIEGVMPVERKPAKATEKNPEKTPVAATTSSGGK